MKQKKIVPTLFYLERQRLSYFSASEGVVHTLVFTSEAVYDLEVQNKKALERLLDNWLATHQIQPQSIALVLAEDSYFVHDSTKIELSPEDDEYKHFLSFVPFDDAHIQTFPLTQGSRTLAVSKDFLHPIMEMLEARDFRLSCVSPDFVFAEVTGSRPFADDTAKIMAENLALLEPYSFISKAERERKLRSDDSFTTVRFDAKILVGIGVFVVLLGVLGLLVWQTYGQVPAKTSPSSAPSVPVQSPVPTAPDAVLAPTTPAVAAESELLDSSEGTAAAAVAATSGAARAATLSAVPATPVASLPETIMRVRVVATQPTSEVNRSLVARLEQAGVRVSLSTAAAGAPRQVVVLVATAIESAQRELLKDVVTEFYPAATLSTNIALQGIDAEVSIIE
jgi:hypothetical protein